MRRESQAVDFKKHKNGHSSEEGREIRDGTPSIHFNIINRSVCCHVHLLLLYDMETGRNGGGGSAGGEAKMPEGVAGGNGEAANRDDIDRNNEPLRPSPATEYGKENAPASAPKSDGKANAAEVSKESGNHAPPQQVTDAKNAAAKESEIHAPPPPVTEGKEKEQIQKNEIHAPPFPVTEAKEEQIGKGEIHAPVTDSKEKHIQASDNHAPPQNEATEGTVKAEEAPSTSGATDGEASPTNAEKNSISDMNDCEKKALAELRSMVEHAIVKNKLLQSTEEFEKVPETSTEEKSNKDVSIWGVPLLPSKGDKCTDEVLLKFLRARDYKASDAFEMLRNTLQWRRQNNIDAIAEDNSGDDADEEYAAFGYMKGSGVDGHPICYNVYGVFADDAMYNRTFGSEAGRDRFLRWRLRLLEKEIRKLDFQPGGISSMIQVNDLKNAPVPSRKDLRLATRGAVEILQDNYPEFVAKNIFINVPFWYYAFNALLSPFLTQRAKSKFIFSRPSSVTETLLKCIAVEQIPMKYGGLQRDDDPEFSTQDTASQVVIKAGATGTVEIPMPEVGKTMIWDLSICGWDVNYKEEFVPTDEESYTVIVKKGSHREDIFDLVITSLKKQMITFCFCGRSPPEREIVGSSPIAIG
ncbi:patellin-4-like [Andrographis paniculata]|uniref:patellin-4-like n=1 Tax=Andrographis paniculata TaxID=175694 RepID=UPI0021E72EB5|nr:patellin-4-like [Andrographis paniculata]